MPRRFGQLFGAFLVTATLAAAPPLDETTRSAVLDAARAPAAAALGKPVLLKVRTLRNEGVWAFLVADMQGPGGAPIDYAGTSRAEAAANGAVSKAYVALLKREGERWTVIDRAIGPTDVAWTGWANKYGAPENLFQSQ